MSIPENGWMLRPTPLDEECDLRVLPEAERLLHHLTQRGYDLLIQGFDRGYLAMARQQQGRHVVAVILENGSAPEALRELEMELERRL
ncbi:hypothetical protein [Meiothermus granaticius]|uniref:Uncharacterized protein n=1 Tax=Meiothermus granaticius NBRC 107808 TaxID=1227551 RepID=A0A399F7S7_9DEIN|nr:hypothetical protein [Meiothermus granaticius]RIH90691.1 hypothetical protein Mgrana_03203 [Meiothermus granaticius NBRC 107808]GEM88473.1 hypothetical protein MGR01S_30980 [Meiothermus granaticius NBRC 107808]